MTSKVNIGLYCGSITHRHVRKQTFYFNLLNNERMVGTEKIFSGPATWDADLGLNE